MKKIIWIRHISQTLFLLLIILGLRRTMHPALVGVFFLAFIAGNFFCGWLCPFGTCQEVLGKLGFLIFRKKIEIPSSVQYYAKYSRYFLMLLILVLGVIGVIEIRGENSLPINAYNSFQDTLARTPLTVSAYIFLGLILCLSIFINRPFCNYFCYHGLRYALPNFTRIFTVKRKTETCVNCKVCDCSCPMNIQVSAVREVRNLQCINCFMCISGCPHGNQFCR